jgi:hypothetical protein
MSNNWTGKRTGEFGTAVLKKFVKMKGNKNERKPKYNQKGERKFDIV